jgi:hypothetical protein
MTDLEKSKYFMAGVITVLTVGILYLLVFVDIPQSSKDVLNVGLGVLIGIVKEVFSFIFGNSEDSIVKTRIIREQAKIATIEAEIKKENVNEKVNDDFNITSSLSNIKRMRQPDGK